MHHCTTHSGRHTHKERERDTHTHTHNSHHLGCLSSLYVVLLLSVWRVSMAADITYCNAHALTHTQQNTDTGTVTNTQPRLHAHIKPERWNAHTARHRHIHTCRVDTDTDIDTVTHAHAHIIRTPTTLECYMVRRVVPLALILGFIPFLSNTFYYTSAVRGVRTRVRCLHSWADWIAIW